MSLSVIEVKQEGSKARVTIRGEYAEVCSPVARKIAIDTMMPILGVCGISGSSGPYPDNPESIEEAAGDYGQLCSASEYLKLAKAANPESGETSFLNDFVVLQSVSG